MLSLRHPYSQDLKLYFLLVSIHQYYHQCSGGHNPYIISFSTNPKNGHHQSDRWSTPSPCLRSGPRLYAPRLDFLRFWTRFRRPVGLGFVQIRICSVDSEPFSGICCALVSSTLTEIAIVHFKLRLFTIVYTGVLDSFLLWTVVLEFSVSTHSASN